MTSEEMEKELKEANYTVRLWHCDGRLCYRINMPDGRFDVVFGESIEKGEQLNAETLKKAITIAWAHYQRDKESEALRQLHQGLEMVESWLRQYDFEHAEIVYDYKEFLAQTSLSADGTLEPRTATGKTMIEAVTNWKAEHE